MTLLWTDGFEQFTTGGGESTLNPVYDFPGATGASDVGVFVPDLGGKAVFNDEGGAQIGTPEMFRLDSLGSTDDTWIVGYRCRINHTNTVETEFMHFRDSASASQITIKFQNGTFHARQGNIDAAVYGMADVSLPTLVHFFFEIKIVFHATTGSITIRVNEQQVMNLTGLDTINTGSGDAFPSEVWFGGSNSSMRHEIDDLYIADGAGSLNNDFLGDVANRRLLPTGNGATNDFLGSDGNSTDNYLLVDEDNPDSDTTYTGSATVGEKDLYAYQNLASSPASIAAISVVTFGKKTDAGAKTFVHVVRSNVTEEDSAALTPAETYGHQYSIFETDPNTSAAWTEAGVNAAQAGVKVAS